MTLPTARRYLPVAADGRCRHCGGHLAGFVRKRNRQLFTPVACSIQWAATALPSGLHDFRDGDGEMILDNLHVRLCDPPPLDIDINGFVDLAVKFHDGASTEFQKLGYGQVSRSQHGAQFDHDFVGRFTRPFANLLAIRHCHPQPKR